jgi:4-diphosphocytidyl-2-C-methyl-D-erythritol kinase
MRAVEAFRAEWPDRVRTGVALTLDKMLPVASGIGGGSADAAAALKALAQLWTLPLPAPQAVLALGADVPVCLSGRPARMRGIGEVLDPVPALPPLDILLVNPRVSVSTPAVFRALAFKEKPPMPPMPRWHDASDFCAWLSAQRNDLYAPAQSLAPKISEALALVGETGALFSGMSGSGATCFGLFAPGVQAEKARAQIVAQRPDWWVAAGKMLS